MNARFQSAIMKQVVQDAGKCELCGSKRCLEAHHIIPVVCGGEDTYDNLICVCSVCHTKLTPRSTLSKMGIKRAKERNAKYDFKIALYKLIEQKIDAGDYGSDMILDAIEEL